MKVHRLGKRYITIVGAGNVNIASKTMIEIGNYLENLTKDQYITSYLVRVLYDETTILDGLLKPKDVLLFSEDKLPVVFVSLTHITKQENEQVLEQMTEKFDLKLLKTFDIKQAL